MAYGTVLLTKQAISEFQILNFTYKMSEFYDLVISPKG